MKEKSESRARFVDGFLKERYERHATSTEVKKLRKITKLSQAGLAGKLGIGIRRVQGWEQGVRNPDGLATKLIRLFIKEPKFFEEFAKI